MPKLSEYKILDYFMTDVVLTLDLTKNPVLSNAVLTIQPNPEVKSRSTSFELNCENMILGSILLNGQELASEAYELKDNILTIKNVPQDISFSLETNALLGENTDLFGLYQTEGTILVKAETEGLRRVFPCIDRPDNLAKYTTTIIADKNEFPTLLANGVGVERKELGQGIHSCTWKDLMPKPSYLFAMVAGKLVCTSSAYKTKSGRKMPIEFHLPEKDIEQCAFAMDVLKTAMEWDETRFKVECPLPNYMIAGVDKYASGASEPLGLNLFNTANLFANKAGRTDKDRIRVMEVVAHEYFHTLSGNLVTIRDWFNLAAKEGLTTFRASLFLEYILGFDPDRLFTKYSLDEHAPRPDSYTAVRSLYTSAAYEKSAEVFRMVMNYMGEEAFNKAFTTFTKQNRNKAVTLEQILDAYSKKSGHNVHLFIKWFAKSGVPHVQVSDRYEEKTQTYTLKFSTLNRSQRPILMSFALFNQSGERIRERTILLKADDVTIRFDNIKEHPIPSLLRNFSAPVTLEYPYTEENLMLLMRCDNDYYNKCKAAKILMTRKVQEYCAAPERSNKLGNELIATYLSILNDNKIAPWVVSELLSLPSEEELIAELPKVDFEKIAIARKTIQKELATALELDLHAKTEALKEENNDLLFDMNAAGAKRLKALSYSYLLALETDSYIKEVVVTQYHEALGQDMTETINALTLLADADYPKLDDLLQQFYDYWQDDSNAINYWFNLQAAAHSSNVVTMVSKLLEHPAFDRSNPNKVNALLGTFMKNSYGFHALSGEGYKLVASFILQLEKINPTLAANLTEKFNSWERYDKKRQNMMIACLKNINKNAITNDVSAIAKKGLEKVKEEEPSPSLKELLIPQSFLGVLQKENAMQRIEEEEEEEEEEVTVNDGYADIRNMF
jgi:aminopeptidase N